jgi:hypothetical protein
MEPTPHPNSIEISFDERGATVLVRAPLDEPGGRCAGFRIDDVPTSLEWPERLERTITAALERARTLPGFSWDWGAMISTRVAA